MGFAITEKQKEAFKLVAEDAMYGLEMDVRWSLGFSNLYEAESLRGTAGMMMKMAGQMHCLELLEEAVEYDEFEDYQFEGDEDADAIMSQINFADFSTRAKALENVETLLETAWGNDVIYNDWWTADNIPWHRFFKQFVKKKRKSANKTATKCKNQD